jgi:hypothetical protein
MKKPSQRDLAVAGVIALLTAILTWAICAMYYHNSPVTIENPANEALKKRGDSLEAVITFRDSLSKIEDRKQAISDSILINNNKTLKKDYDKYKELDVDARIRYFDSILSSNKVRR